MAPGNGGGAGCVRDTIEAGAVFSRFTLAVAGAAPFGGVATGGGLTLAEEDFGCGATTLAEDGCFVGLGDVPLGERLI